MSRTMNMHLYGVPNRAARRDIAGFAGAQSFVLQDESAVITRQDGTVLQRGSDPPLWDPSQLTNLELWLKPEDLPDVATTVATWADSSGNGNDATQATEDSKPAVVTGLDGKKAAKFDGIDDYLTGTANTTGNQTLYIVVNNTVESQLKGVFSTGEIGVSRDVDSGYLVYTQAGGTYEWRGIVNSIQASDVVVYGTGSVEGMAAPAVLRLTVPSAAGVDYGLRYNNEPEDVVTPVSQGGVLEIADYVVGARISGVPGTIGFWLNVEVSEVIIIGTNTPSTADDDNIMAYFAAKYPTLGL